MTSINDDITVIVDNDDPISVTQSGVWTVNATLDLGDGITIVNTEPIPIDGTVGITGDTSVIVNNDLFSPVPISGSVSIIPGIFPLGVTVQNDPLPVNIENDELFIGATVLNPAVPVNVAQQSVVLTTNVNTISDSIEIDGLVTVIPNVASTSPFKTEIYEHAGLNTTDWYLETDRVLNSGGSGTNLSEIVLVEQVSSLTRNVPVLLTRIFITKYIDGAVNSLGWGDQSSTLNNGYKIEYNGTGNNARILLDNCIRNREPFNQGWTLSSSTSTQWGGGDDTIQFEYRFPYPVRIPVNTAIITVTRSIDNYGTNDVDEFYIGAEWYRDS